MDLKDFIANLRPIDDEINVLQGIVNSISNILKNDKNLSVASTLIGGSFGKKTMLRGNFEADVVFILNREKNHDEIMEIVLKLLQDNFPKANVFSKKKAITVSGEKPISKIEVDVLPAFDINSPKQLSETRHPEQFTGSSTKFHLEYTKQQFEVDKEFGDLIRILKYWKSLYNVPLSGFQIELLAANGINGKNIANWNDCLIACFNSIIKMSDTYIIYPVDWDNHFKKEDVPKESKNGILIVDPGNPKNNVAGNISKDDIEIIADITKKSIEIIKTKGINTLIKNE